MATSVGLGMRMSTIDDPSPVFAVNGRVDEYSIHSEVRGKTAATVSLSASYECNATLRVGLCSYNGFRCREGNHHLFSATIGQDLAFYPFIFSYRAGLQAGMNIPSGARVQWTLSPLLCFEAGVTLVASLALGICLSGGNEREASLQSTPLISPYLAFEREHFFARLDADFRYSNLSTDRPFPLQAFMILFSAGYRWR